jgi:hypothetical protein
MLHVEFRLSIIKKVFSGLLFRLSLLRFFLVIIMSTLDSDTAAYTLEREAQGSKSFFNKNPASDWSFQQYLDCTFILLNKSIAKNFQFVVRQYKDDLEWLLKQNIPRDIKKLVKRLRNEQVRTVALFIA